MKPVPKATSRPHMLLPTVERTNAFARLIRLLIKLEVVSNRDLLAIPAFSPKGKTYYHRT